MGCVLRIKIGLCFTNENLITMFFELNPIIKKIQAIAN